SALGDTVFAIVTGFGLTVIAQLIRGYSSYLELIGGGMLIYFGVHNFIAKVETRVMDKIAVREKGASSLLRAMASTLVLTITNPATLLGFAALFAGLGGLAGGHPNLLSAAFVVIGVAGGAALWWLVLTTVVGRLHASINDHTMVLINRGSGIAIIGFGLAVLIHLAIKLLGL
ncbi:MAG TPA: LysE family transporter, partial [Rhizomicrobium sp.]|nr:LysE family transporter [Rhizomicrobium sp.]